MQEKRIWMKSKTIVLWLLITWKAPPSWLSSWALLSIDFLSLRSNWKHRRNAFCTTTSSCTMFSRYHLPESLLELNLLFRGQTVELIVRKNNFRWLEVVYIRELCWLLLIRRGEKLKRWVVDVWVDQTGEGGWRTIAAKSCPGSKRVLRPCIKTGYESTMY